MLSHRNIVDTGLWGMQAEMKVKSENCDLGAVERRKKARGEDYRFLVFRLVLVSRSLNIPSLPLSLPTLDLWFTILKFSSKSLNWVLHYLALAKQLFYMFGSFNFSDVYWCWFIIVFDLWDLFWKTESVLLFLRRLPSWRDFSSQC